ncbi:MAG: hypothetical protein ACYDC1_15485, partial [Limisphaerales bacterium]
MHHPSFITSAGDGADPRTSAATGAHPVVAETAQAIEGLTVLNPVRRDLAGDDVVWMANGKTLDHHSPRPGVGKPLDSVRREDQIEIEGSVLQLNSNAPITEPV